MGGEKLDLLAVVFSALGSPPRGRGKDVDWLGFNQFFRITPAWAGKSHLGVFCREPHRDHPRVGGEKRLILFVFRAVTGSPPRGRGKGDTNYKIPRFFGITPAWAGKSFCRHSHVIQNADHPRVGGEKSWNLRLFSVGAGSPPRGRGKVLDVVRFVGLFGITPAWAGKSFVQRQKCHGAGDHPRVGGEKTMNRKRHIFQAGSPPRGRGKAPVCSVEPNATRITPAWAGKRLKRSHRSGIFISGPIPFHSVLHRPAGSGGSRAGRDGSPAGQPQNTGPA